MKRNNNKYMLKDFKGRAGGEPSTGIFHGWISHGARGAKLQMGQLKQGLQIGPPQ